MADKELKIGASIEVNDKQIKTEFTKAGEEAGKSVAEGLEKQQGTILDKINDTVELLKTKIEALKEIDFSVINPDKTQEDIDFIKTELDSLGYIVENLKYGWGEFGEEGAEAFAELNDYAEDYRDELENAMNSLQGLGETTSEAMIGAQEQVEETTEAIEEMNESANQGISENGGLGKMLKFLSSKEIVNFFYRNLKKIGEKLIELSGDSEKLAEKRGPVQDKLEAVGGYIGKGLTPAVESAIEEIDGMATELIKTGEDGSSALGQIQQGVYWIGQAFNAVMKLIKQFGQFLGDILSSGYVMATSFVEDLTGTVSGFLDNIGNPDMWYAVGNNIKYGIVTGVNEAIGSLNNLLKWINENLGVNLGEISTFDAGQKMDLGFGGFSKTKQAREDTKKYMSDSLSDMGEERENMWNNAIKGAEKLKDITIENVKKTEKETKKGGQQTKDTLDLLGDEAKDIREELTDLVDEHQKAYDKLNDEIEKVGDKYDELRDKARDTWREAENSLKDYTDEINKSQLDAITDLGQRYVELKKDLIGTDDYMRKRAKEATWEELRSREEEGDEVYYGYKLKDIIKLKETLEEIELIEENTTEEQRKADEFLKETSKAQEIINKQKEKEAELEEKKADALEKQAIAYAMQNNYDGQNNFRVYQDERTNELRAWYKDAEGKWNEIHNMDNIEYAKQLEDQILNLNNQLNEFQEEKDKEIEILIDTTAAKMDIENNYEKVFEANIKNEEKLLDNIIAKEQKLVDLRREYLTMGGNLNHNAYGGSLLNGYASIVGENGPEAIIARQSSYIQPRNASNSYSTVNNNNLSINGLELGNFVTVDDLLDALKEKLTYRN